MEEIRVNVEEIMAEIREEIRAEKKIDMDQVMEEIREEGSRHDASALPSFSAESIPSLSRGAETELTQQNRNEAEYLKKSWQIPYFREMGGGAKGLVKRLFRKLIKGTVLPMREEQDEYNRHTANSVDGLRIATEQISEEASSQLRSIHTMAEDLESHKENTQLMQEELQGTREELQNAQAELQRVREELQSMRNAQEEMRNTQAGMQNTQAELQRKVNAAEKAADEIGMTVAGVIRHYLEPENRVIPAAEAPAAESAEAGTAAEAAESEDRYHAIDYFKFQNSFRGTQADIMERQKVYLPFFRNRSGRIFDLGCGRGEFLRLMKEENIPAFGVDMYSEYTVTGQLYGIDIQQGDGIALLENTEEKFGGIFCAQVIEHIGFANIEKLCKLAFDRLEEGGCLVLETPNPMCVSAMTNAFYLDPTHERPVHPLLMEYMFKTLGFREVQLVWPDHSLERLPHFDADGIRNIDQVNRAMDRLSDLLFGSQDYAVIGKK